MSVVRITAPSRLHFGLFSFGHAGDRQYGGVGVMIERPGLTLTIQRDEKISATGPLSERAVRFAQRVAESLPTKYPHGYRITIQSAPPDHVGLGTGTQLGLAIVAGILKINGYKKILSPSELAQLAGRGERSAIGTYGFLQGGLLMEAGKRPSEQLSPLLTRAELPRDWRFVLFRPAGEVGLSGSEEQRAFAALQPVPENVTQQLCAEAVLNLLPAALEKDFAAFSRSLRRYSRLAGECFLARQGGPYASEHAARIVNLVGSCSVVGVGQSSWGPTLFALLPRQTAAEALAAKIQSLVETPLEIVISAPANRGASVEIEG